MTFQADPEHYEAKILQRYAEVPDRRILEIGCGDGRLTWTYAKAARSVTGIDLDPDELRVARIECLSDLRAKIGFSQADAVRLPFRSNSFDLVLMTWSLCCIAYDGMLNALHEAQRVLSPGGILIDLRAAPGNWSVEVASGKQARVTGRVGEAAVVLEDDAAANRAIEGAAHSRWFQLEKQEAFSIFYYWDSPAEMQEYIEDGWQDFAHIDDDAWGQIRSAWALADADARLRVRVKVHIGRWRRQEPS